MDYRLLGERIKHERLNVGLTQEALAEKVEITTQYVSQIERGERKLSLETFVRISKVLGVSTDYLLQSNRKKANPGIDKLNALLSNKSEREINMLIDVAKSIFKHYI